MNYRMIFNTAGKVLRVEALLMALPLVVSLIYGEWQTAYGFIIAALAAFVVGYILVYLCKPKNQFMYAKEGLVTVAIAWIVVSVFGALPFTISGEISSYIDALFETVSGFTTTGASILTDVESMSHGCLMWRSFAHWIGGMGVLVFILAITSKSPDRSMHILRAEMPGPIIDKVVPRAKDTTLILYIIYSVMTAIMVILLLCGGMDLFESLVHAFGTAGAGGFSIKADGLAGYSAYHQWVIAIGMLCFGVNFNLYYLIIIGKVAGFFKSRELLVYVGIVFSAVVIICFNIYDIYGSFAETLRHSVFQTSSIITTSGFSTVDFNNWPTLSKIVLVTLMFIGGCAGSTAGGLKVSRLIIVVKKIGNDLKKVLHPRTANIVKFEGKRLDDATLNGVSSYTLVYIVLFFAIFFLLSFDTGIPTNVAMETNFTAAAACFNNVGPGLSLVGPMGSDACYSPISKIILTIAMLLGRLEIYPLLLTLTPTTWIKK